MSEAFFYFFNNYLKGVCHEIIDFYFFPDFEPSQNSVIHGYSFILNLKFLIFSPKPCNLEVPKFLSTFVIIVRSLVISFKGQN